MTPLKTVFRLDSVTKLADKLSVSVLAVLLSSTSLASQELPQNGQILSGTGSIVQDGADMSITQNSANLDIDWNSFSIGAENTVTFKQPSATSTALNRVTGTQTSAIHGKMTANGRVFLLNPNGVMFGAGAQVNVGSLVASTLGLSKTETNNSGSQHEFEGDSAAAITNAGQIATNDGGTIALIAAKVTNTGSLTAPGGTVALGAGRRVRLDLGGTVALEVDEAAVDALITQGGAIRADGGLIYLGAKAAGDLAQTVINHSGTSQAQTLATGKDGRIFLMGDMRNDQIDVSGTLDASAPNGGDGGFVETSAAQLMLRDGLRVTTKAHVGKTGTWLIDPTDIEIIAGDDDGTANWSANQIKAGTINAALAGNNVEIKTAAADPASGAETGNITVNAGLTWGENTLTLKAHDNIIINAKIDATGGDGTGTGGLVLHYGQNGSGTSSYRVNAPIDLASTGSFKTKNGTAKEIDHTIITNLGDAGSTTGTDLQGMRGKYDGNYVLGADIDASATSGWNDGKGFAPIGFTGTLDGLGHEIIGLNVNRPDAARAGLFGVTANANLQNITLRDATITGKTAGGLVGLASGTSFNNITTHNINVTGTDHVGGLVGNASGTSFNNITSHNINVTGTDHVGGLVGWAVSEPNTNTNSNFNTIRLDDINVTGTGDVGGLVGNAHQNTTIETSYAMGTVTSTGTSSTRTNAGGLVGWAVGADIKTSYAAADVSSTSETANNTVGGLVGNATNTKITNAYATGKVAPSSATADIGGLVGQASGSTIANTYATGEVTGDIKAGGLVGSVDGGTITASLWDTETTGQDQGVGNITNYADATGKTSADLRTQQTYTDAGWDFDDTWFMLDGQTRPFLRFEHSQTITNPHQLQLMAMKPDLDYTLGADIDMQAALQASNTDRYSGMWGPKGFDPIGDYILEFTGTFDGLGHVIKNLTINKPLDDTGYPEPTGLFGAADGATIQNVGLTNVNISGGITGEEEPEGVTGGLAGYINKTYIKSSFVTGQVSGEDNVGGLVGYVDNSSVKNSYSTARVYGKKSYESVGGLIGYFDRTGRDFDGDIGIFHSYAAGLGEAHTKLLVGKFGKEVTHDPYMGFYPESVPKKLERYKKVGFDISADGNDDSVWRIYEGQSAPLLRIFMKKVNVTGQAVTRDYNGKTDATISDLKFAETVKGVSVASSGNGQYADANAGVDKTVTFNINYTLADGETDLHTVLQRYDFVEPELEGTINKKALTATATASDKTYDGNTTATGTTLALSGLITGEKITATVNKSTFNSKDVTEATTVTVNELTLNDGTGKASNYSLANGQSAAAKINKKALTATATASDKTYDGNTTATGTTLALSGLITGEKITATVNKSTFNSKDVTEATTVTVNELTLNDDTGKASNYSLANGQSAAAKINKKALTATATASDKTYDGNTTATGTTLALSGLITGEKITATVNKSTFNSKDVTEATTVTVNELTLNDDTGKASNYSLANGQSAAAKINKKALTATATASDKTYDGNTTATGTTLALSGLITGEKITATVNKSTFNSKDVTEATTVTVNELTLKDDTGKASNYRLANGQSAAAKINKKALTATATASDKTYDGNTTATGTTLALSGLITGEKITATVNKSTFNSKDVTEATTVTVNELTLNDGTGKASNYSLATGQITDAKITAKALTITANDVSKTYGETLAFKGTEFKVQEGDLQNGETIGSVKLTSDGTAATAGVKDYTITAAAATAAEGSDFNTDNYTITYKAGTLDVVEPLNVSGAVEPGSSSTVSKAPPLPTPPDLRPAWKSTGWHR